VSDDDPRHGTTRGYAAGCRRACCREARNTDERTRRKRRQVLGIVRSVPASGTQRRIRALMAIGWTSADIATRAGWGTPQAVTELLAVRRTVFVATAATIAAIYDDLCMTPGPSEKNRRDAQRKGWPPPLAWDDIDDPDEAPHGWRYQPSTRLDTILDLIDQGVGISAVVAELGISAKGVERWLERHGRRDLYVTLRDREDKPMTYRNQWTKPQDAKGSAA
jgi:hypothetical protein